MAKIICYSSDIDQSNILSLNGLAFVTCLTKRIWWVWVYELPRLGQKESWILSLGPLKCLFKEPWSAIKVVWLPYYRDHKEMLETTWRERGFGWAHASSQPCQGTRYVNEATWTLQISIITSWRPWRELIQYHSTLNI